MSRHYTAKELKDRASVFLSALENNDPRCDMLIMMLSMSFNMDRQECINKIKEFVK